MFEYRIIRSSRRTLGIVVSPEKGVVVRAPYRATVEEIRKFVEEKSEWIERHLSMFGKMKSLSHTGKDGEHIMFRGREYRVSVVQSDVINVTLKDGILEVGSPNPEKISATKAIIELWYRHNAEVILRTMFKDVLFRYSVQNFKPAQLTIRKMKGKWGSCTSKGRITLNSELIKLNDSLVEYVIIHELCHLKHPNHGEGFYSLLGELVPQWQEMRKQLKKYVF